jgi:hypothetical protein
MVQELNSFTYAEQKGAVKNGEKGHGFSCRLHGTANAGDFVKIKNVTGSKVIVVEVIAADTDNIFGMIPYESAKKNAYVANDMVTVMSDFTVVVCEASAAIAAGATVMPVVSGMKVATQTYGKTALGIALKPAAADTNLVEVLVKTQVAVAAAPST